MDSATHYLADRWLFVHPDHRRSSAAKDLLLFAKAASVELGCPLLMTTGARSAGVPKACLFDRHLPVSGSTYYFQPEDGDVGVNVWLENQAELIRRVERGVIPEVFGVPWMEKTLAAHKTMLGDAAKTGKDLSPITGIDRKALRPF